MFVELFVFLEWVVEKVECGGVWAHTWAHIYIYAYMYVYTYIYAVELLAGPSLALLEVIIWSKFVFFLKYRLPKNTIKIGVSALFFEKKLRAKNWKLLSGPSWVLLRRSQLGPDNNFQLGPDNNFQKCHFFVFFLLRKMCENAYFYSVFWKQPKTCQNPPPKNDNFSHFAKHRFIKNPVMLQPPFWPKIGVFQLGFFETKNNDVEQKT